MTREEAIKELKEDIELYIPLHGTIDDVDRDLPDGRLITALEMGIKALEQEPCEDAISRRAVLDITWEEPSYTDALNVLTEVRDKVKDLPPVNPQSKQKVGEWILQPSNKEQGERDFIWWKCSECGQVIYSETEKDRREFHAFCNRCGAKMVEPQESEET